MPTKMANMGTHTGAALYLLAGYIFLTLQRESIAVPYLNTVSLILYPVFVHNTYADNLVFWVHHNTVSNKHVATPVPAQND